MKVNHTYKLLLYVCLKTTAYILRQWQISFNLHFLPRCNIVNDRFFFFFFFFFCFVLFFCCFVLFFCFVFVFFFLAFLCFVFVFVFYFVFLFLFCLVIYFVLFFVFVFVFFFYIYIYIFCIFFFFFFFFWYNHSTKRYRLTFHFQIRSPEWRTIFNNSIPLVSKSTVARSSALELDVSPHWYGPPSPSFSISNCVIFRPWMSSWVWSAAKRKKKKNGIGYHLLKWWHKIYINL